MQQQRAAATDFHSIRPRSRCPEFVTQATDVEGPWDATRDAYSVCLFLLCIPKISRIVCQVMQRSQNGMFVMLLLYLFLFIVTYWFIYVTCSPKRQFGYLWGIFGGPVLSAVWTSLFIVSALTNYSSWLALLHFGVRGFRAWWFCPWLFVASGVLMSVDSCLVILLSMIFRVRDFGVVWSFRDDSVRILSFVRCLTSEAPCLLSCSLSMLY